MVMVMEYCDDNSEVLRENWLTFTSDGDGDSERDVDVDDGVDDGDGDDNSEVLRQELTDIVGQLCRRGWSCWTAKAEVTFETRAAFQVAVYRLGLQQKHECYSIEMNCLLEPTKVPIIYKNLHSYLRMHFFILYTGIA